MLTAKIFVNGRSQAVRLPKECQFEGDEVCVQKLGDAVIMIPRSRVWDLFNEGLGEFSADFMADGREPPAKHRRAKS